eukprot:1055797-Rhodomonas_salina.1
MEQVEMSSRMRPQVNSESDCRKRIRMTEDVDAGQRSRTSNNFADSFDNPITFDEVSGGVRVTQGNESKLVTRQIAAEICERQGEGYWEVCESTNGSQKKQACAQQVVLCCEQGIRFYSSENGGLPDLRAARLFNLKGKALLLSACDADALASFHQCLELLADTG